jgi:hypothetical protein
VEGKVGQQQVDIEQRKECEDSVKSRDRTRPGKINICRTAMDEAKQRIEYTCEDD